MTQHGGKLLDVVGNKIRLRHYSIRTKEAYIVDPGKVYFR